MGRYPPMTPEKKVEIIEKSRVHPGQTSRYGSALEKAASGEQLSTKERLDYYFWNRDEENE